MEEEKDPYRIIRKYPKYYRRVAEIGWAIACANPDQDRLSLAAQAESLAMELVADIIQDMEK